MMASSNLKMPSSACRRTCKIFLTVFRQTQQNIYFSGLIKIQSIFKFRLKKANHHFHPKDQWYTHPLFYVLPGLAES